MESTDILITNIEEFLLEYYKYPIYNSKSKKNSYLNIDFKDLAQYNPELADLLIDDFEQTEKAFEIVLTNLFESEKVVKPRFKNMTSTIKKDIWRIRSRDVDKLIVIEGYIRRIGDIQHEITLARFECPSCSNSLTILMNDDGLFKSPTKCSCGRKGRFTLLSKETRDIQKLIIEDDPLSVKSPQKPRSILVNLTDDLCRSGIDKFLQPSKKVRVLGLLKDRQVKPDVTLCQKYIIANSIEVLDESIKKMVFSPKEIEQFKLIAKKRGLYEDLAQSIIPNIEGHMTVKIAILLQLMGGVSLFVEGHLEERGLIHILLVGSPGVGKSVILKRAIQFLPNSRFTGGRGISGVGLIGAVIKDEDLGGYVLDIGAVPLTSNSIIAIDECFPADTEILTEKGFIRFDNLIQGIKVAQFHEDNRITFIKPERIITKMYRGHLLKVKSYFGEHVSTPNHKRVIIDKDKKLKKLEIMDSLSTLNKIPVSGLYDGRGMDFSNDELRFIVAFAADGCIKNNCYGYINIKKERKIKRFEEICTNMGIAFSCNIDKSNNHNYHLGKIIEKYFPKIDGKIRKKFKEEWICGLSLRQKEIVLQELMYWNGYKYSKNCWQFFTSRLDYLNFVCSLASTSGYYTHIYRRKKEGYNNYSLTFNKKQYKTQQKLKIAKIPYEGLVYCVTVPSGMIIIKQKDYIQVSGNCDKISKEDIAYMNNAMVDLVVRVDKGNVHQTVETNTMVLAAANPKNRIFDKREVVWKQIGLPKDFLDRFDLIFPIQSGASDEEKKKVAHLVVGKYRPDSKLSKPIYPHDFMVRYIAYAKKNITPKLTQSVEKYIVDNFINIIKPADPNEDSAYFSYRLLTNIIRLAQASARTRLSNEVTIQDTKRAINILLESLKAQDIITPEGLFDYERAEAIVPREKRSLKFSIIKLIRLIQDSDENKLARYDIIKERAINELKIDIDKLDEFIEKLRQDGDIIEVIRGKYKVLE